MRYKRAAGCSRTYWPCVHEENFWTSGTVCIILRDERYLGKTVFGKRERDKVGLVHTVKKSKSDWIVVDDVHEPIVSEELFQAAQAAMREYTERSVVPSPRNPLRRKVICGVCGYAMQLSNTKNAKYTCRTAKLGSRFDCPSEGVPQADIHEAVVSLIRTYAQYAVELERLKSLHNEHRRAEESRIKKVNQYNRSRAASFQLVERYSAFVACPSGGLVFRSVPIHSEHCIQVRKIVVALPEIKFVPLNQHPLHAFAGSFHINAPPVNDSILIVPLSARIIIEIKRNLNAVVFFHHLAECYFGNFPDQIITGNFIY